MTNRIILITGASSGIGEACAKALADKNTTLILAARRDDKLREVAAACAPARTHIVKLDVTDEDAMKNAVATLPKELQAIDVLINNAGGAIGLDSAASADLADWNTMIDSNIRGLITMTRLVLPGMKERGRGHIINISSIAGSYPYAGASVYGGCKAFVTYFSLATRADLLGTPVRVTNIEPGMVETEFSLVRFKGDEARAGSVYANTAPLLAEDIAACVKFSVDAPAHVNINRMEVMPTMQAPGGPVVSRKTN